MWLYLCHTDCPPARFTFHTQNMCNIPQSPERNAVCINFLFHLAHSQWPAVEWTSLVQKYTRLKAELPTNMPNTIDQWKSVTILYTKQQIEIRHVCATHNRSKKYTDMGRAIDTHLNIEMQQHSFPNQKAIKLKLMIFKFRFRFVWVGRRVPSHWTCYCGDLKAQQTM